MEAGLPDLWYAHKTWMIEDSVPEAAQAKRLGHRLPGLYIHVAPIGEQRLFDGLQKRWEGTAEFEPER
ncbi:hypothetical protein [Actinoplanes sp. NBRC 101535]|uniref:hypothetical protein n=1 Tax=Actinoplanes sp. NBRC 101535 TaxID=3032196 RepID=UPI0024A40439|nr:hypothetical protein [Actinoplanes sp. NBRC 101535]GLY05713.1 hypothetical protein Acsp01_60920 [Actinoplanes sp. NBRC 101535]